jgi:hypothetical protein
LPHRRLKCIIEHMFGNDPQFEWTREAVRPKEPPVDVEVDLPLVLPPVTGDWWGLVEFETVSRNGQTRVTLRQAVLLHALHEVKPE